MSPECFQQFRIQIPLSSVIAWYYHVSTHILAQAAFAQILHLNSICDTRTTISSTATQLS